MRDKRSAKDNQYILIDGFAIGQAGHVEPRITLNRGNAYNEQTVRTIERFPVGTKYATVLDAAKAHAERLNVKLGRNFTAEEWSGMEFESPEWIAWKKSKRAS